MKQNNIFVITGVAAVIISIIVFSTYITQPEPNQSSSITADSKVLDMKEKVEKYIQDASYYTITNATTPAIAIDKNSGTIYAAFFRNVKNGGNLYVVRSDDGGKTFSDPVRVNQKEGEILVNAQWSAPGFDIGPNGELHVVWYHADYSEPKKYPYGQVTLQYSRSLDDGKTFEPQRNPAPDDPKGEQSYPYIAISDENHVYISYLNLDYSKKKDNSGTPTVVRVVSSMDGGKIFTKSIVIDHSACQCCATVSTIGPDDEVYVSSRSTFLDTVIQVTNETRTAYYGKYNNVTIIRDITVSHSIDDGHAQLFSERVKVGNDEWYMNGCPDSGPGMAFDSTGRLHIAWFTGSEEAPDGQGFYYTHSDDNGLTYSKPIPIHLLSEKWIPPTTQYLVVDKHDNSWIVFVNSEGLKKSPTYEKDYTYVGDGSIHLAVIDKSGNIILNGAFVNGDITKHYPFTYGIGEEIAISWIEGDDVKFAVINTV